MKVPLRCSLLIPLILWVGCVVTDPEGRALQSGCVVCPAGFECRESPGEDSPVVRCIPAAGIPYPGGDTGVGDAGGTGDAVPFPENCSGAGCPCVTSTDCDSAYCAAIEGVAFCSEPCALVCTEQDCPDGCPDSWVCVKDDEGLGSCSPN